MCGVCVVVGGEKGVVSWVAMIVGAKEFFFQFPCVFRAGVALPLA